MPNAIITGSDAAVATCSCDPRHIEVGATDPWCEVHAEDSAGISAPAPSAR